MLLNSFQIHERIREYNLSNSTQPIPFHPSLSLQNPVLEDLVGEYILNISKEKLKVSTIKGKIKLDNVELDGDFIGSHILSAVGLSGFGVLSCWAQRLQINIPWKNLDNEPTSLEIRGMHLICVPLLPATANRVYYGGGVDSSLSLRTRAKRAALARLERNFFSGRIPGEENQQQQWMMMQQQQQQQQQVQQREDEDVLSYSGRRRQYSSSGDVVGVNDDEDDTFGIGETSKQTKKEGRIPALKRKLKAKIYGNLVSSLSDVHIRFEVPEGGLERSNDNTISSTRPEISDERAFAFGLTLKSLTARNVSQDESSGSIDSQASNNSDTKRKKIDIQDLSIYWDDGPPFLISESDLFTGRLTLATSVSQQRIAEVMQQMSSRIDPSVEVKRSLSCKDSKFGPDTIDEHDYICTNFSQAMHTTFCKGDDDDSLHFVEILPSNIEVNLTPQQYRQYQRLKDAVLAQQRFDTMLHQRPTKSPTHAPRLWWQYAIACVRHNPTSRSWTDVKQIVQCRKPYIELVMKNLLCESETSGFHGGLTKSESWKLLELESLLPIETLISFHLLALRRVVAKRFESVSLPKSTQSTKSSFIRKHSSSVGRRLFNSLTGSTNSFHGSESDVFSTSLLRRDSSLVHGDRIRVPSLLEDDDVSLPPAPPTTHTTCKLNLCSLELSLLDRSNQRKAVTIKLDFQGTSYDSGSGKSEITFDMTRFDVFDFVSSTETRSKVVTVEVEENASPDIGHSAPPLSSSGSSEAPIDEPPVSQSKLNAALPFHGSVCRVVARADGLDFSLDLTAQPATVFWSQECASFIFDWSASVLSVSRFISQLKNATTPGAHRAQIALLYPTSFSLRLDVSAPKLWIPVSRELKAGALLLDAGRLTMTVTKPRQSLQTDIDVDVGNINIMLAREIYGWGDRSDKNDLAFLLRADKKFVNIVQPFEIHINGQSGHSSDIEDIVDDHSPLLDGIGAGKVSVTVGAIHLNLIDVEKLAKALGRLLATGVSRMKQITESGVLAKANLYSAKQNISATSTSHLHATDLRIFVESVEMLLESYSATESLPLGSESTNRSYLVGIRCIRIHKRSMGMKSFSRFSVSDANVQLAEAERGTRRLKSGAEQIFASRFPERGRGVDGLYSSSLEAPRTPNRKKERSDTYRTPLRTPTSLSIFPVTPVSESRNLDLVGTDFIHGCLFHDGENHGDEIEVDIMPAIMKITPTSIQDCAGAVKRIFECGIVISKEMERRVHTGGRIARASSTKRTNDDNTSNDSSLLFRVAMKDATILLGRPASDFTFHRNSTRSDYVIQILTKASFIGQSIENEDGSGSRTQHVSVKDFAASISKSFDRVELTNKSSPMLVAPTSADVRVVRKTEREGRATSQDFSVDIESTSISVVPHDIQVITSVVRKVLEKLNLVSRRDVGKKLTPFMHAKKKGSGIATTVRVELHSFSFVIMRSFKPKHDVRPFLDVYANLMKVNVEGCAAFLIDLSLQLGVKFFNPCALEWEDVMESNEFLVTTEMMPSETTVSVSSRDVIRTNCSAIMIQEIARIEQVKNISVGDMEQSSGGKRFFFTNETGLEVRLIHNGSELVHSGIIDGAVVPSGDTCSIDSSFRNYMLTLVSDNIDHNCCSLSMAKLASRSSPSMFRMGSYESFEVEPVVEFVMENQRLTPDISDVYDIEKGHDLLDSKVWSPALVSANERRWLPPYHLEGDAPEWSDTSCTIHRTKHSVKLPDSSWFWINDWEVDIGEGTDADGWEYTTDFGAFNQTHRRYMRGDSCRRRRWTRTRAVRQSKTSGALTNFYMVLDISKESGITSLKARSRFRVVNDTSLSISIWSLPHSQEGQVLLGSVAPAQSLCVPILHSVASFIRLASSVSYSSEDEISESIMIIPTGFTSNRFIRTSFRCDLSQKTCHFLLHLRSERGVVDIIIQPVLTLLNLLPCQMQIQLGELKRGNIERTEERTVDTGIDTHCSVNCRMRPHLSIKVPGYQWSRWNMIINRESNTSTWLPTENFQRTLYETSSDDPYANEMKTVLQLEHICDGGGQLQLIMSVDPGPVPVLRFYAQYWIIDKTALGLSLTCGSKVGSHLEAESLRKTYLPQNVRKEIPEEEMKADGHEWSLGMCGMTLFFSAVKTISFSVCSDYSSSNWSSSIDVDKPMPESVKTAISVEDLDESKRFELAYNVTRCPSLFSRTSIIAFYPRYQVVNLIGEDIYVAQEGALGFNTHIAKQSCMHISGIDSQLLPKIRFSVAPALNLWTLGGIELDKIGITSIRIPTATEGTLVVQCEVRLASKRQDSAVVVVIWASNKEQNPLYLLRNTSQKTVFCAQLLSPNIDQQASQLSQNLSFVDSFLPQCGSGFDPYEYDDNCHNEFVWSLRPGESKVFGFCNPEKSHILQWSVNQSDLLLQRGADVDVDMVGFSTSCVISDGEELHCTVQADRSTKVVLFSSDDGAVSYDEFAADIEDFVALSLKVDLPGIAVSVVDNASLVAPAREIFLVCVEDWKFNIAQSREGFHELEMKLARIQVDNFMFDTDHRVLVSIHGVFSVFKSMFLSSDIHGIHSWFIFFISSIQLSSKLNEEEFLHITLVRRLQDDESTMVLSYAAFKLLDLDISLDRK